MTDHHGSGDSPKLTTGEALTIFAYGMMLAQAGCKCNVETSYQSAAQSGGIRDAYMFTIDTNGCIIHAGKRWF